MIHVCMYMCTMMYIHSRMYTCMYRFTAATLVSPGLFEDYLHYTQIIKNEMGVYEVAETNQEQQRSSAFGMFITVIFIIWASERTWANLL